MPEAVYMSAAVLSAACAIMLFRGYFRTGVHLLFWSALCFMGLSLNNIILFVDRIILPTTVDLSLLRGMTALVALSLLVHGLVAEAAA